jgi:hypothetical protein
VHRHAPQPQERLPLLRPLPHQGSALPQLPPRQGRFATSPMIPYAANCLCAHDMLS